MKNVLFATTALVAFAGAASAASHGGMSPVVSFSGEMTAGYNDVIDGGMFYDANVDVSAVVDLGDSVTATLSAGIAKGDETGTTLTFTPTIEIAYSGAFDASLKVGDMGDKGASEYFYKDRSGMAVDVENQDNATDARALLEFGNFGVAFGCQLGGTNACQGLNVGAGATFGSIKLGVGYDSDSLVAPLQRGVTAVSADATFGSFDIGVSYATGAAVAAIPAVVGPPAVAAVPAVLAETSIGVAVGATFGAIEVGAYYAQNSVANNEYGVSADYSAGALSLGAYYDNNGASTYGLDLEYAVSSDLSAFVGVKSGTATSYYAGIEYAVNSNISATVSYANANEISGPEFKDGITALITAEF